jgi:hypothetical protein
MHHGLDLVLMNDRRDLLAVMYLSSDERSPFYEALMARGQIVVADRSVAGFRDSLAAMRSDIACATRNQD